MKLYYAAFGLLLFTACHKPVQLELTLNAPDIHNGTLNLMQNNEIVLSQKIKDGQTQINRQLATPDYYQVNIIDNDKPLTGKHLFDVYLEQKPYQVSIDDVAFANYPKITTTSAIQNQLSDYYKLAGQKTAGLDKQISTMLKYLASNQVAQMTRSQRSALYASTRALQKKRRDMDKDILTAYFNQHPESKIGAHIMAGLYYPENPKAYAAIFEKFPASVKTSDDGLKISNKLNAILGVMSNAKAPDLTGNTPDGKLFNISMLKNKVTLIEFWKSSHEVSRLDHQKMLNGLLITPADRSKFGMLSVSLDTSSKEWINVLKRDGLNWPQISDLKGDQSPNAAKWNISKLPAYFLVDKTWHIIKADVDLTDVDSEVHEYLKTHPNR